MEEITLEIENLGENITPESGGFMKYYGLFWKKECIDPKEKILAGLPSGWIGQGKIAADFDKDLLWINFWDQKGVYVLYDDQLSPVYAGQAGLTRKGKQTDGGGKTLGARLVDHMDGKYRNGWHYFSWFGFLQSDQVLGLKKKMKTAKKDEKQHPKWKFSGSEKSETTLNLLLDSFEAILIEAFTPRFNARGGNLKDAVYVNQFEGTPFFLKHGENRSPAA